MSDIPKSPIRNVFKKKRKESGECQELEEVPSSDQDHNHDHDGQSYLPSSLRFDNTIENLSPTRSLDAIKQVDEYNIDDSDDDNDNNGDLQLRGKRLFGVGNDTEMDQSTEEIFVEDDSYELDNDTGANADAGALETAKGVSLEIDTDFNAKMKEEDNTLGLVVPAPVPVPAPLPASVSAPLVVDGRNEEERTWEPQKTDENNGNNNNNGTGTGTSTSTGICVTIRSSNGRPTSLMSGMHSDENNDITSTSTSTNKGNEQQNQHQPQQQPQDVKGASTSVKDDSAETTYPQSKSGTKSSGVEFSTAVATSSSVSTSKLLRPRTSILRSSSVERRPWASQSLGESKFGNNGNIPYGTGSTGTDTNANANAKVNISKKAVSFADENGGIIAEQQTIDVSPSKLSRKIRRGRSASPYSYGSEDDEDDGKGVQKGVMGRILVLLMDPPSKQYELTSLPYPLVSNENGIVGPTQLKALLGLVANSASFEPLRQKTYKAFMRPEEVVSMDNEMTILDYKIVKDEVLVSIPEGYNAEECARFSKPILQDKRLVRLLKKLKKHARKSVKKRRLKSNGMKPNRYGSETTREFDAGLEDLTRRLIVDDAVEDVKRNWVELVTNVILTVLIALIVVGAVQYLHRRNIDGNFLYSVKTKMQDKEQLCGRGAFCRPFGVKQDLEKQENAFMARLKDGIKKWKLENDDLLL